MSCNVCIGDDSADQAEFYNEILVQARKPHKCCECGRAISKGMVYQKITGKWDGDFDSYKTCLDCMNIRNGLSCAPVGLGNLWPEIGEVFDEFKNTACLDKIKTASAKAFFLEQWREHKGLDL